MHTPVLLKEVIENLDIKKGGKYIDATFGEGGYSREILRLGGEVLGIDLDKGQLSSFSGEPFNSAQGKRGDGQLTSDTGKTPSRFVRSFSGLRLILGNFADIEEIAKENDFFPVDGIVFDLGLSMRQIKESGRGFSYRKHHEKLDMRMDTSSGLTAGELIRKSSAEELHQILARNSEEIRSKKIAFEIKKRKRMETVGDLLIAIDEVCDHPNKSVYSRIFQALRVEVNDEFGNLRKGLKGAVNLLKKNAVISVVSFHSLEDRIIKSLFKDQKDKVKVSRIITKKDGKNYEKIAKLRIIRKL